MTRREGIKASRNTQETVGPGSYNGETNFYKPTQPFFPRSGMAKTHNTHGKMRKGPASIRGNYYDAADDEDEHVTPGPGSYLGDGSTFKSHHSRTSSVQLFGSSVKRFNDKNFDSGLGPGQYKPKNTMGAKFNSVLKVAGSATFKTPMRED